MVALVRAEKEVCTFLKGVYGVHVSRSVCSPQSFIVAIKSPSFGHRYFSAGSCLQTFIRSSLNLHFFLPPPLAFDVILFHLAFLGKFLSIQRIFLVGTTDK